MRLITAEVRVSAASLLDWHSCLLSKLVLLLGIAYLFVPLDLIPDSTPIFGHFDESALCWPVLLKLRTHGRRTIVSSAPMAFLLDGDDQPSGVTDRVSDRWG